MEICWVSLLFCISHLLYNSDLLHKQTGTCARETGTLSCHGQILAGRATTNDIYWRQLGTVEFCNIPDMDHVGEPMPGHLHGKDFDFTGPYRDDPVMDGSQRKSADPIK